MICVKCKIRFELREEHLVEGNDMGEYIQCPSCDYLMEWDGEEPKKMIK